MKICPTAFKFDKVNSNFSQILKYVLETLQNLVPLVLPKL